MTYHRGTLAEFDAWHNITMDDAGIVTPAGRIGNCKGAPAPDNQRTVVYSTVIPHPTNEDDYIWIYGAYVDSDKAILSQDDVLTAGWFAQQG